MRGKRLNFVAARGKWYVYSRDKSKCLLRGYVGSRDDVEKYVGDNLATLMAQATENASREAEMTRLRRAKFRRLAAVKLHGITSKRCKQKGLFFDLTVEQIYHLLFAASDACEVCGLPFDYGEAETKREWHRNPSAPSLDRVMRGDGYRPGNVRVVYTSVNIAINEWGLQQFLKICHAVAARDPEIVLQTDLYQPFSAS